MMRTPPAKKSKLRKNWKPTIKNIKIIHQYARNQALRSQGRIVSRALVRRGMNLNQLPARTRTVFQRLGLQQALDRVLDSEVQAAVKCALDAVGIRNSRLRRKVHALFIYQNRVVLKKIEPNEKKEAEVRRFVLRLGPKGKQFHDVFVKTLKYFQKYAPRTLKSKEISPYIHSIKPEDN